jgi:hypothetical protein
MNEREELQALRRLAELEAKAAGGSAPPKEATLGEKLRFVASQPGRDARDLLAGAVRGAGSIGSTLMAPMDALNSVLLDRPAMGTNNARRADITGGLQNLGADPSRMAFGGGKLLAEVGGTLGVGPALGGLAGAAGAAAPVVQALTTAGMRAGGLTGPAGLATRAVGGTVTGGAAAGLVDPEMAATGAGLGALLPGVMQAAGATGRAIGSTIRGPQPAPNLIEGARRGIDAGYVVPPTQVRPTLRNRLMEGFAGKLTTAQNASAKNQAVTNNLVKRELGIADDVPLSLDVLDDIRKEAGKAYQSVASLGRLPVSGRLPSRVQTTETVNPLLFGKEKSVDAAELVQQWKQSNADATAYYRSYGRTADPETLTKARQASADAKAISEFMESSLDKMGKSDLVQALREARVRIAKTHSAEAAMNPASGNLDARRFAKDLAQGKKLSGGFAQAGDFAARFPTAARPVEGMGSLPQTSPLDWFGAGGLSVATGNPLMMLGAAARPLARTAALSGPVQRGLLAPPTQGELTGLLADPAIQQLLLRSAPVIAADR